MAELNFDEVVDKYYSALYRFALGLTRNEAEAFDLTQQTFYVWATKGHQLRDPAKIKSWLLTTLHRDYVHARKREVRFPHHEMGTVLEELPHVAPKMVEQMDGDNVLATLGLVDEVYRTPLMLFYLDNFSYREIAEMLDIPTGTVMSRLSRGKAQLRELLAVSAERKTIVPLPMVGQGNKNDHG